ncbi:MAG TPA: Type 1 glutamine amidotransferase-like domain-containing protein [Steroidobacteraceae bacterium]|nr:Type 1 glutamine amidotransferase-like domain-containing protein [Steroidobacteraceae bacterium]
MPDLLILGPQLRAPVLREALARISPAPPAGIVAITAGWQEREGELDALEEHLGQPVRDLRLYERAEAIFELDRGLGEAHRARQNRLKEIQELYRLRLDAAKAAARELMNREEQSESLRRARRSAVAALRRLDAELLREIARTRAQFEPAQRLSERPAVARQRAEIGRLVDEAALVLVAGGHVAVLLNRLRLFDLPGLLRGKLVAAWSAGAMALSDRIVLFHDRPPQGAGNAEVFEAGLGLVNGAVFLPDASTRLRLRDPARVRLLAQRFAPANCYALDDGAWLFWRGGRLQDCSGAKRLLRSGRLSPAQAVP